MEYFCMYLFTCQECNSFLAGNEMRSSKRYKALDETAVMGSVCRHEIPMRFFNLLHGERSVFFVKLNFLLKFV